MALRAFDFPENTLKALDELAEITGVEEGKDRLAKLIQDAIRTYEWIIAQQSEGKIIVALDQKDVEVLKGSGAVHGEGECVDHLFLPDKLPKVKAYFHL